MLLPIPEEVLQAQARDRALDTMLGSLGISAAVVSASFAAYMVVVGPARGTAPVEASGIAMAGIASHGPRAVAPPPHAGLDGAPPEPETIDFDPTGSIAAMPGDIQGEAEPSQNPNAVLPDFAVRDAFDGTALVEAHGTLQMVKPGAIVEGAGKVLSIVRRGSGWMVATSGGLILQRR